MGDKTNLTVQDKDNIASIAEDNEFFKRMLSLIPPVAELNREQDAEEEEKGAEKRKKSKKERKKERKQQKKDGNVVTESDSPLKQTQAQKHGSSETNFTGLKHKNLKLSVDNSDSESDEEECLEPVVKKNKLATPHNIPVNHKPPNPVSPKQNPFSTKQNPVATKQNPVSPKQAKQTVKENSKTVNDNSKTAVQDSLSGSVKGVSMDAAVASTTGSAVVGTLAAGDPLIAASISSLEEKRAKLREKIEQLQAKRKNITNSERFNKRKLKRQESKMKLKQKRKLEKLEAKQNKQNGDGSKPVKGNTNKGASPVRPVFNNEGQMVFSKFDFTDSAKKEKKQTDLHGKDYKRLLEKIERRNQKINKVKSKDESAGKALEDKFKWQSVLHKAEGEKVKDNPEMLKKALKRKQKIADQRKKKWEKRVEHVEKMKDDRQKKRNENIQKRKQAVKDKKMQKLKKKGRILPGF